MWAWPPLALLLLGAVLRLLQYLADRPLWYDEAMLANNVLARSFAELTGPLSDAQVAPVGFLYLVKAATLWMGGSEPVLRFVPLVLGLASLALLWAICTRLLPRPAALLALAMFAVSPRLIYYSAELKQYSADVTVGLAIMLAALEVRRRGYDSRWIGALAAAGAVGVWLSQPSVFVVGGVLLALALDRRVLVDRSTATRLALAGLACVASFGASFALARSSLGGSDVLPTFWTAGFLPLPPTTLAELGKWGVAFARPFHDPLSFTVPLGALGLYVVGTLAIARRREAATVLVLLAPMLLALLAAGLHLYPYGDEILHGGRVLLFLSPLILIPVAAGAESVRQRLRIGGVAFALVVAVAIVLPRVAGGPLESLRDRSPLARSLLIAPPVPPIRIEAQDPRPVMKRMAEHTRTGDPIYVYTIAGPVFRYYAGRSGIRGEWMRGSASGGDPAHVAAELEMLRGHPRVWLFFAFAHHDRALPFLEHAGTMGVPMLVLEEDGVGALLYDFTPRSDLDPDLHPQPQESSP